jgi:alpha/beta superfamily hydrolase
MTKRSVLQSDSGGSTYLSSSQPPIRREVFFFGGSEGSLFGSYHLPDVGTRRGIVICSPLFAEHIANYRREVMIADALASSGFPVLRFHYSGTGHSDGDSATITFDSLREDMLSAIELLRTDRRVDVVVLLATKLPALVAASVAEQSESPLVLCQPAVDGASYFRDVFRSHLMNELKDGHSHSTSSETMLAEMHSVGYTDILGYPVTAGLYDSFVNASLTQQLERLPSPSLLVQVARKQRLSAPYDRIIQWARDTGRSIAAQVVVESGGEWLPGEQWRSEEGNSGTAQIIGATTKWLADIHLQEKDVS